jgi:hypothetical protein
VRYRKVNGDLDMGTVAPISNVVEHTTPRSSVYLVSLAASIVPIFLACLSSLSCQQRYYVDSHWGGVVVFSSILIYSFGKRPRVSANNIEIATRFSNRELLPSGLPGDFRPTVVFALCCLMHRAWHWVTAVGGTPTRCLAAGLSVWRCAVREIACG